jgi:hypothetical protein
MGAQIGQLQQETRCARWSLAERIGLRFCLVYLGLFCLTTQIVASLFSPSQGEIIPDPATIWPISQIVLWTAAHVFHVPATLAFGGNSASGDDAFGWVLAFCLLVFTVLATAVWSLLDQGRENYVKLLNYGLIKVIPLQMPFPYLTRLLEPFGDFSPMGVLWSSIGASPAYEVFAGCAELLGGILLIFPRTTTFGALICVADMTQVFVLNVTYDVPVKLFSFHLILLSLFLLAPEFERLTDFFFRGRGVEPSRQPPLFLTRRANRIALAAQILFGVWMLGMNAWSADAGWKTYGGGRPSPLLYGIWSVEELSIDEQIRSPLVTDYDRWRRVIIDFPEVIVFQRMDDSFAQFDASTDAKAGTIALTKSGDNDWKGNLTFQRVGPDQLLLDGAMGGHKIHMRLALVDTSKFALVSRGSHWVQEQIFNR